MVCSLSASRTEYRGSGPIDASSIKLQGTLPFTYRFRLNIRVEIYFLFVCPQAAICSHRSPSPAHSLTSIVSVTTPENFASQRLIGKQLGSPVELVEVWPSWDSLAQYEKALGWAPASSSSHGAIVDQTSQLDFYPGWLAFVKPQVMDVKVKVLGQPDPCRVEECVKAGLLCTVSLHGHQSCKLPESFTVQHLDMVDTELWCLQMWQTCNSACLLMEQSLKTDTKLVEHSTCRSSRIYMHRPRLLNAHFQTMHQCRCFLTSIFC